MKYKVGDIIETGSVDIPGPVTFEARIQAVDPDRGPSGQYHVVPEPGEHERVKHEANYEWMLHTHETIGTELGWWVTEEEVVGPISLKDSAERILEELNVESQEVLE